MHVLGIRRTLVGILLFACAGCAQQPGDLLIGRWEGRPKGRVESSPGDQAAPKSSPAESAALRDASGPKNAVGSGDPASAGQGEASSKASPSRVPTPSVRQPALLDAFDVTIHLDFVDRHKVRLSISGAGEKAPRTGRWRVLKNDDKAILIEIVSPESSADSDKPRLAGGTGQTSDGAAVKRQFLVRFSGDNEFTLSDPAAPLQQGELVFHRVE